MISLYKLSLILVYLSAVGGLASLLEIANFLVYVVSLLLLVFALFNDLKLKVYIPRLYLTIAGFLLGVLFLLDLSFDNLLEPFGNLLCTLIVIKALEKKQVRDLYQILLLSLFAVAVATTFRFDLSFLALFLYELVLGTLTFMIINAYANLGDKAVSKEFLKDYLKTASLFIVGICLLSIPFFVILPRPQTPLFDSFLRKNKPTLVSGISDHVEIGKVGEIQLDNTVVMRVYGEVPPDPYWRVTVFDTLSNNLWIKTVDDPERVKRKKSGKVWHYRVILEPTFGKQIPTLDYPLNIQKIEGTKAKLKRIKGGVFELSSNLSKPIRFWAVSTPDPPTDPPDPVYTQLPEDLPESIINLAKDLSKGIKDPEEKIKAVEEFFKREGFSYTLRLEKVEGHPLEDFLFRKKRGNCEYFASATVLILRAMGVPARMVGGYKGYIKNEYGDYYIVTNSMAHVWTEAYVNGSWVRVDTTPPYVSPQVFEISKWDLIRDSVVYFWYENVVDFSAKKQVSLAKGFVKALRSIDWEVLKETGAKVLGTLLLLAGFWITLRYYLKEIRKTPENLYRRLLKRLRVKGVINNDYLLPEDLLKVVKGTPCEREVLFIVRVYQKAKFSKMGAGKVEIEEAFRLLRKI